jgi:hypothetical protein
MPRNLRKIVVGQATWKLTLKNLTNTSRINYCKNNHVISICLMVVRVEGLEGLVMETYIQSMAPWLVGCNFKNS